MSALLEVLNLRKEFALQGSRDTVKAVNGVSFAIARGETLGLVGESGSGKTTVGRLLLNLVRPTTGRIIFDGVELSALPDKEYRRLRPRIQMVFQDPYEALNPRMRVVDLIRAPLRNERKLDGNAQVQRVRELLSLVRLDEKHLTAYPHQLSGGQQQRVGIARALATSPDFVVLDEPVSNLDPTVRAGIIDLLMRIQQELGVAYVFISHDLTTVRDISQRVAIMYLGEIVEIGPTENIFREQRHPYSRALLSAVLFPDPDQELSTFVLQGEIPSPIDLPRGCFLASRCPLVTNDCLGTHPVLEPYTADRSVACFRADLVPDFEFDPSLESRKGELQSTLNAS